ncbi:hypothetical protein BO78DRAFT_169331 [Aspergillus sclerotiicarbonarius CBS 121057]|uniref:Uncharacterized protein n=1 Tax=Aspergillus sclerotiicarbonarius (strain CBS 121057 / IBT 28362) TaxID=1448318 RepID=A0A319ETL0_ASPSB|nr:hypothetical protein BO78DRAFT_169331 [Aspergillus sclerotiicarbonarius CBS 121057]
MAWAGTMVNPDLGSLRDRNPIFATGRPIHGQWLGTECTLQTLHNPRETKASQVVGACGPVAALISLSAMTAVWVLIGHCRSPPTLPSPQVPQGSN